MDVCEVTSATQFGRTQPYRLAPFNSRAWGHKFHSLCSYQGKLKPAIAHFLVREFSKPNDTVLDPLGGVGTVAFEAALMGRKAITNDISPLAFAVSLAKVSKFEPNKIRERLESFASELRAYQPSEAALASAEFGLNGKVRDYYHPETLREILFFRERFLTSEITPEDAWIRANLLHILHGNRPYALSRLSHPVTPMHPKGPFVYKSVLAHLNKRVRELEKYPLPAEFKPGRAIHGSFEKIPAKFNGQVNLIITSPPFLGMRFDRPNWLRMWFMGWAASDFHQKSLEFLDRRQTKGFECYAQFFETCVRLLAEKGLLVIHLGGSAEASMAEKMLEYLPPELRLIHRFEEDVEKLETFGISDRGKTKTHEFIFLQRL